MCPRSGAVYDRIRVALSITEATCSSPWDTLMWSQTVSMAGKVQRIRLGSIPFSKGARYFGSNVSVLAIPPPIHSRITLSAVVLEIGLAAQISGG